MIGINFTITAADTFATVYNAEEAARNAEEAETAEEAARHSEEAATAEDGAEKTARGGSDKTTAAAGRAAHAASRASRAAASKAAAPAREEFRGLPRETARAALQRVAAMLDGARLDPEPAPAFAMTAPAYAAACRTIEAIDSAEWMAPDYDDSGLFA